MNKCAERLYNGLVKENPTFVLMLGMCPTLAVTTSAINGIGMGLSTTAVLVMSNMLISMLRKVIPASVRMPAFIVVVASFVTIVDFLMAGFVPGLYKSTVLFWGERKAMHQKIRCFLRFSTGSVWDLDSRSVLRQSVL